jgi:hypothetical protein
MYFFARNSRSAALEADKRSWSRWREVQLRLLQEQQHRLLEFGQPRELNSARGQPELLRLGREISAQRSLLLAPALTVGKQDAGGDAVMMVANTAVDAFSSSVKVYEDESGCRSPLSLCGLTAEAEAALRAIFEKVCAAEAQEIEGGGVEVSLTCVISLMFQLS